MCSIREQGISHHYLSDVSFTVTRRENRRVCVKMRKIKKRKTRKLKPGSFKRKEKQKTQGKKEKTEH